MKKDHIKTYIIVAIFISIIGISIAYASLSQQLQIKTSATVQDTKTSWNIVFEQDDCYVVGFATKGTVKVDKTSVIISGFTLQAPGDSFACDLYIKNKGDVDAKISSVEDKNWPTFTGMGSTATEDEMLIRSYIWGNFKWNSPTADIKVGEIIPSESTKKVRIQYGIRAEMPTLPANPVTFSNAVTTINFEQA